MIAYDFMLVNPATNAGIKVPDNLEDFNAAEFPHWRVYTNMQCGRSMPSADSHWENAKVIAAISNEQILTITAEELVAKGFA